MSGHSPRQREILHRMGIQTWRARTADESTLAAAPDAAAPPPATTAAKAIATAAPPPTAPAPAAQAVAGGGKGGGGEGAAADTSLAPIAAEVADCRRCPLHQSRTQTVFGCGDPNAEWMLVGEAPGQNEDLQGEPFVGRAGQLLDKMIAALGMQREQVYIANVLKCRPPGNRDPSPQEVEQCEPYLHRQLALIRPKVIVALGRISAQALLKTDQPLGKLRGQTYCYGPHDTPLVVTYHPAYLLRSPGQKARAWEDLWLARSIVRP